MDPRTPVLVGGGQVSWRDGGREPVDLLVDAAERAAAEAGTTALLSDLDAIDVVGLLSWRYRDPGALLAERLGVTVRRTGYTGAGGNSPQALVNRAAADIAAGRADAVLIGGAEAWRTRTKLRARGERPAWTVQDETVPAADVALPDVPMKTEGQVGIGLDRPAYVYPLFEQAIRVAAGRPVAEHQASIAALWARFSDVAATNPHAWLPRSHSPEEILASRMVSWPYPKLLNANNAVDQAAAVLLCSVERATRLGIASDRWIFVHAGAEAHDRYDVAERYELHRSPAIRHAGAQLFAHTGSGPDDVALVDVYSCFPSAVQVAVRELGLDPDRPLTVTGGLTFAGGPWNNYSTHAIAALATALREQGGSGLLTANGGYLTKHALGLYGTRPAAKPFARIDAQPAVDAERIRRALVGYEGPATVESWTVAHDRDGAPERAFVALLTAAGDRTLAGTSDPELLDRLLTEDVAGARFTVAAGSLL
ncbi:acetyl-CoA acetyltransferase [Cryptosporangium aurantiacum]|uniref:Acetyl-CoA C-acetyltransferase n=1 Tax=Cryptosporangium aurantiacum TaxID=134849 RepID=A0A1M7RK69_9ACTN|nr:acetyl-CoA acetyltransferase [Cryptosporangium aurantiacum]SHN46664.1 acetyl-CoA C-acetyltransferase [Cryptosporangium aurantiacum]